MNAEILPFDADIAGQAAEPFEGSRGEIEDHPDNNKYHSCNDDPARHGFHGDVL